MSSQVKDAREAIDIAHKIAQKAGLVFWFVSGAKKENDYWVAQVTTLADIYIVKINALTGEVVEFSPIDK